MPVRVKNGRLFFDFCWKGIRCKEYTGLTDTPENGRRCENKMREVEREIRRGTFDYREHFPRGTRLHLFCSEVRPSGTMSFQQYTLRWHRLRSPFLPDGSLAKDAELHASTWLHDEHTIRRHLLPGFSHFPLDEIDVTRVNEFRRALKDSGLAGKTITNIMGMLHKMFEDALEEDLIRSNPVRRITTRRRQRQLQRQRSLSQPLIPTEVARFLAHVPDWYREFYNIWFRVGWRPSEIVAVRFGWLDFEHQLVSLKRGRLPRWGGIEADPKTGPRDVDCSYDPEIFLSFARLQERPVKTGRDDFVFTDPGGSPLNQEWLHKRVWLPTLRDCGISERGQYNIRDTFITIALSAGEDPGWVAQVCGTSEEMIFRHYRRWIPGLQNDAGRKVGRVFGRLGGGQLPPVASPISSPGGGRKPKSMKNQQPRGMEAGGIEPPKTGNQGNPRDRKSATYAPALSRHLPWYPVIWAPGAHALA